MASSTPVLWQIKISHYNEKARWALDYKGVPHKRRSPLPLFGTLPAAWLMTRGTTLPVLRLDGRAIADLTAAALSTPFLRPPERQYLPPEPPPEPLYSFSQEIAARPAGRWVFDIFRRHRGTSAEIGARPAAVRPAAAPAAG